MFQCSLGILGFCFGSQRMISTLPVGEIIRFAPQMFIEDIHICIIFITVRITRVSTSRLGPFCRAASVFSGRVLPLTKNMQAQIIDDSKLLLF